MAVFYLFMAIVGLVFVVDGVTSLGRNPVAVHIVSTHVDLEAAPALSPDGGSESTPVTVGEGYYIDDAGAHHSMSVRGDGLRPGKVIRVYPSLLGLPQIRSPWQSLVAILLGLALIVFFVISAVFSSE
jgi:hypothetical protein